MLKLWWRLHNSEYTEVTESCTSSRWTIRHVNHISIKNFLNAPFLVLSPSTFLDKSPLFIFVQDKEGWGYLAPWATMTSLLRCPRGPRQCLERGAVYLHLDSLAIWSDTLKLVHAVLSTFNPRATGSQSSSPPRAARLSALYLPSVGDSSFRSSKPGFTFSNFL